MKSLTDEQLMEMYQNNTDGRGAIAFDHLYARYARRMLNYLGHIIIVGTKLSLPP